MGKRKICDITKDLLGEKTGVELLMKGYGQFAEVQDSVNKLLTSVKIVSKLLNASRENIEKGLSKMSEEKNRRDDVGSS